MAKRKTMDSRQLQRKLHTLNPDVSCYGDFPLRKNFHGELTKSNYGAHCMRFDFMGITFWFSYTTLIAFQFPDGSPVRIKNYWGPTTGRHMSNIPGVRWYNDEDGTWTNGAVSEEEFYTLYANGLKKMGLYNGREMCIEVDPETRKRTGVLAFRKNGEAVIPPPFKKFHLHPVYKTPKEVEAEIQGVEDRRLARNKQARDRRKERKQELLDEVRRAEEALEAARRKAEDYPGLIEEFPAEMIA